MASQVTVRLSDALFAQLQQAGVFVYAVAFDSQTASPAFTTIIDTTAGQPAVYNQSITLSSDTYNSGKIYFLIQSQTAGQQPPTCRPSSRSSPTSTGRTRSRTTIASTVSS